MKNPYNPMNGGSYYERWYTRYYFYLRNLYINRFKWTGLPKEIPPYFLEELLLDYGQAVFFRDDVTDMFAVSHVNEVGMMDNYNHPQERFAWAVNYMKFYDKTNSVLGYDTYARYPYNDILAAHADAMAQIRLTFIQNLNLLRTPYVVKGNSNLKLTFKNLFSQLSQFIPWIQLSSSFDMANVDKLDLGVQNHTLELMELLRHEKSDFCTEVGITSEAHSKKERLVSGETKGNDGETEANLNAGWDTRKRFSEAINDMWGLKSDVEPRSLISRETFLQNDIVDFDEDMKEVDNNE